jgi:phospholipid/cholesterol/gamma-HCH transport system permease protein
MSALSRRARPARQTVGSGYLFEIGGIVLLLGQALRRAVKRPIDYGAELVIEFRFALRVALFPLVLLSFAFAFGPAGVQASDFLGLFGALDRLGAAYQLVTVREFAPLGTAIVLAGCVGTSICADLGAREVREETPALRVLGVDPIKSLVVPRMLVIVLLSVLLNIVSLFAGVAGAVVVCWQNHAPLGPFFATFFANATTTELAASFVKAAIFGVVIASVSCYKGLNVSGSPEAVGRAVNQSVVIAFLMIGAIDYAFTQYVLATHPLLSETR